MGVSEPRRSLTTRMRGRLTSYRVRTEAMVTREWRRALVTTSRDWTRDAARQTCLVVAAHPDDETLGCGALIARKRQVGTAVKVYIASDGRNANPASTKLTAEGLGEVRRSEAVDVCAILGVAADDVIQPGLPHLRSDAAVAEVTAALAALIEEFAPAEIYVNSALDYHPDHKIVNRIVRDLVARLGFTGRVAEFPVWYLFDGPWEKTATELAGRPTLDGSAPPDRGPVAAAWYRLTEPIRSVLRLRPRRVASEGFLDTKRAALATYKSQTTNFTGEPEWTYLDDHFLGTFLQPQEVFFPIAANGPNAG